MPLIVKFFWEREGNRVGHGLFAWTAQMIAAPQ